MKVGKQSSRMERLFCNYEMRNEFRFSDCKCRVKEEAKGQKEGKNRQKFLSILPLFALFVSIPTLALRYGR
jgi:hypothetical protein